MKRLFSLATILFLIAPVAPAEDLPADRFDFEVAPADEPDGAAYTWHEAVRACEDKGMALPSVEEMAKMFCHAELENKDIVSQFPQIDEGCATSGSGDTLSNFKDRGRYWTSSRHNDGVYRYVDFLDGSIGYYGSDEKLRARCILPEKRGPNGETLRSAFPYDINDIDEESFIYITDTVASLYEKAFADHGKQLMLTRRWEKHEEGANSWFMEEYDRESEQISEIREIRLDGGLARHPMLNRDAYAMVICHEIGHHVGGAPASLGYSSEGQSDYFAASKCMKRYLKVTRYEQPQTEAVPDGLEASCAASYSDADERKICRRNILAGLTLSRWFAYSREVEQTELTARDPRLRSSTLVHGYPGSQCRLDTFVAGALCPIDENIPFSDDSVRDGACTREAGYQRGARPRCWFSIKGMP